MCLDEIKFLKVLHQNSCFITNKKTTGQRIFIFFLWERSKNHPASDTEVSAVVPPDSRAASLLLTVALTNERCSIPLLTKRDEMLGGAVAQW